jgi:UrcA family protein
MDTNATSPKHSSHLLAAALSVGATICAATAGAAYAQTPQRAVETVSIADLDLSTADGARAFLKRLDLAAQRACGVEPVHSPLLPREPTRFEQCVREAVTNAVNGTAEPAVMALNSETALSAGTTLASR